MSRNYLVQTMADTRQEANGQKISTFFSLFFSDLTKEAPRDIRQTGEGLASRSFRLSQLRRPAYDGFLQ
jgi:hypothetical protein